uniref:Uncharacterized protein n=1 Tax=Terrapene triunguis TaxID=2587831 RepID=A0A674JV03_9SAUR
MPEFRSARFLHHDGYYKAAQPEKSAVVIRVKVCLKTQDHFYYCYLNIQVFDEQGKDVTPRPLYHPEPSASLHRQSKILSTQDFSGATGSDFLSSLSMHQTSGVVAFLGQHYYFLQLSFPLLILEQKNIFIFTLYNLTDVQVRRDEIKEQLTKEDIDKRVDIYLTETETIWLLDMPTVMMSVESEDAEKVQERNKDYIELCKNRVGNDRFVERMMQTLNGAPKNKEVQCEKILMEDKVECFDTS